MLVFLLFSFFLVNSFKYYFEDHVICLTNKIIAAILMAHTLFWYFYKLMNLINIDIYIIFIITCFFVYYGNLNGQQLHVSLSYFNPDYL